MSQQPTQGKSDAEKIVSFTIHIKRQLLDDLKAACATRGHAVNAVVRESIENYVYHTKDAHDAALIAAIRARTGTK